MKLYGYKINSKEETPMELSEATISADPQTLREIAVFLEQCAKEIEVHGTDWEHEHFESKSSSSTNPSLIVFNQGLE